MREGGKEGMSAPILTFPRLRGKESLGGAKVQHSFRPSLLPSFPHSLVPYFLKSPLR